jgi:hypothetical protein
LSTYNDKLNPYTQWHMQRAFRPGWEAAEDGLDDCLARKLAECSRLNRMTTRALVARLPYAAWRILLRCGMEQLEAVVLNSRGASIRVALRTGPILVVALRLGAGAWEPLYGLVGPRRVELPSEFCWTLEAIAVLEAAALMR